MHSDDSPSPGPEGDAQAATPRDWHLCFAQRALPEIVFGQTDKLLAGLSDPSRIARVPAAVMRRVALLLDQPEDGLLPLAAGIRVQMRLAGMLPVFLFQMPVPMAPGESHFIAVVNRFTHTPRMAYYTLDAGADSGSLLLRRDGEGAVEAVEADVPIDLDAFFGQVVVHAAQGSTGDVIAEAEAAARSSADTSAAATAAADEAISRHNLDTTRLRDVLDRAGFELSDSPGGGLVVRDAGVVCLVAVPAHSRDYVTLLAWWGLKDEAPRDERLECANRINSEYLYIRASIDTDGALCIAQNLPVYGGVSPRHLIACLRSFTTASREAVREHAQDLLA